MIIHTLKGVLLAVALFASAAFCEVSYGSLTDARDGKTYKTVKIGSQTWMAENLNYEYGIDKTYGTVVGNQMLLKTAKNGLCGCYDNAPANCRKYGRLYTWAAAREACPAGWHLPSDAEWDALKRFVAGSLFGGETDSAGYALKSESGWEESEGKRGGSDAVGFGALPAGGRGGDGTFGSVLEAAVFWSSTEDGASYAYGRFLYCTVTALCTFGYYKDGALSVRCVKDS